ncbi:MAG: hypothetical protein AAGA74_07430 [Pseudomonadota bacterium]
MQRVPARRPRNETTIRGARAGQGRAAEHACQHDRRPDGPERGHSFTVTTQDTDEAAVTTHKKTALPVALEPVAVGGISPPAERSFTG